MALSLKCPGCRADNPLSAQACPYCGRSLENLPPEQRVYVLEPAGAARKAAPPPGPKAPPAVAAAAAPASQKPKRAKKKQA